MKFRNRLEIVPAVCLVAMTLSIIGSTTLSSYMAWKDFSEKGINLALVVGFTLMFIASALVLWIFWMLFPEIVGKINSVRPKIDHKTSRLLNQQTNLGNRIFNALQKAAEENPNSSIKITRTEESFFLVTWNELHFDPRGYKDSGTRILHVSLNAGTKEIYVFFYSGANEHVVSKAYRIESIDSAITDFVAHVRNWNP